MKKVQIYNVPRTVFSCVGRYPGQLLEAGRLFGFGEKGKKFRKLVRNYRERWYRNNFRRDFSNGNVDSRMELISLAVDIAKENGIILTKKFLADISFRSFGDTYKRLETLEYEGVAVDYLVKYTKVDGKPAVSTPRKW